jgi:hypothetical protein
MRRIVILALLASCVPAAAVAQEGASADAQRALDAARAAADAAEAAARAARDAADALERSIGRQGGPERVQDGGNIAQSAPPGIPPLVEDLDVAGFRPAALSASRMRTAIAEGVANGPNDRSLKGGRGGDLQLTATADDKVGTFAWTLDVSKPIHGTGISATQFTMSAAASLDKNKEASLLGLKGFPGGTQVSLKLTHYMAGFKPTGDEQAEVAEARRLCRLAKTQESVAAPQIDAACDPYEHAGGVSRFVATYNPNGLGRLLQTVMPGPIYFFGGEFGGSQTDFDYLDRAAFAMKSTSKFGYGTSAYGGIILPSGQTSITGSFTYARRYKGRDPVTLCQAINAIPQTQCITAPDGAPKRTTRAIASLELRQAFGASVGEFASFAIAPEFSYDLNNDGYSLDVPLYLVGDGKGKLRGGVRFGYVNSPKAAGGRESDYSLGLFIGLPFSVIH